MMRQKPLSNTISNNFNLEIFTTITESGKPVYTIVETLYSASKDMNILRNQYRCESEEELKTNMELIISKYQDAINDMKSQIESE